MEFKDIDAEAQKLFALENPGAAWGAVDEAVRLHYRRAAVIVVERREGVALLAGR